jgi:hypothetical protein
MKTVIFCDWCQTNDHPYWDHVQEIEHEGRLKNLCYDCFLDREDD